MADKYSDMTDERLHELMLENAPINIDKRQGSVAYDLTYPAALELMNAYIELGVAYDARMPDTAVGEDLDIVCAVIGIYRRDPVSAEGTVQFSGPADEEIPTGTRIVAEPDDIPLYFTTNETVILDENGEGEVEVTAEDPGLDGNIAAGEMEAVTGYLFDIVSVTNEKELEGGSDIEDDETLRQRYFDRVQLPITSGNAAHYKQWSLEVPGVGDVKVYPIWDGAGTVKVVLIDTEMTAPAQSVIDEVSDHIENERPVGADVTVTGATELNIDVSATVQLASGASISEVTSEFEEALTDYLRELAFQDELIRYTQIANLLLDVPDIIDYSDLTVNDGTSNIEPADEEVGVTGAVNFTDGTV